MAAAAAEAVAAAGKVLEQVLSGEVPEANGLPQVLHIYRNDPRSVITALCEKAVAVVANADAGSAATRAGMLLVTTAAFLDRHSDGMPEEPVAKQGLPSRGGPVSRQLLDHILLLTGGKSRAAKDKAVRAQGCTLLASLAAVVPGHKGAEEKLLEFSLDKVPSIREKAVRGLAGLMDSAAGERALMTRTTDQNTAVRASAVRGLRLSGMSWPALLERIDDVEACVRAQLFYRFADEPTVVDTCGSAALARLVAGLTDRSSFVRTAAGDAVDVWHKRLGGAVALLGRCDVMSDEVLGEAAAAALAQRYPEEGAAIAKRCLGDGKIEAITVSNALFARLAAAAMNDVERDEVIDVISVLKRIRFALDACHKGGQDALHGDFLLRQLLHVVALVDFCDEGVRKHVEQAAEAVMLKSPVCTTPVGSDGSSGGYRSAHSCIDLAVVIMRKCFGLGLRQAEKNTKKQAQEARCSTRIVLLVGEICQPMQVAGKDGEGTNFTSRLSLQIQELNDEIDLRSQAKDSFAKKKDMAVKKEDFIKAQELKESLRKCADGLDKLQSECSRLKTERDGVCLRVLAIISAVLRWSNSELRRDPALFGTFGSILQPLLGLPALSKDVELAAVSAICLFCVRDGGMARSHWSLLLQLVRDVQNTDAAETSADRGEQFRLVHARAGIAARTLVDCARMHGGFFGALDREEILAAASGLAAVPFGKRQLVIEPLCSWMLNLGHIFFEEHLKEPNQEVQWGLGWLLVEAFKQRRRDPQDEGKLEGWRAAVKQPEPTLKRRRGMSWVTRPTDDDEDEKVQNIKVETRGSQNVEEEENVQEAIALATRLTQFFALLPKLPGKHGAPMLSLAVESVAESGLWRRAALMPQTMDGQTRWLRGFSWPELFCFAHDRLPADMRFRLWRCSLQLCVADPDLAPLAEVPIALTAAAANAPPGAAELVQEALRLGAEPALLAPLVVRLPKLPEEALKGAKALLLPKDKAMAAEAERRESLVALGIDIEDWAPMDLEAPNIAPPHHRMRAGKAPAAPKKERRGAKSENQSANTGENAVKKEENIKVNIQAAVAAPEPEAKRRKTINWDEKRPQSQSGAARLPLREVN